MVLILGALLVWEPGAAMAQSAGGDAYLDAAAAALVAGARERQDSANASIGAYEMVARQRVSIGVTALRRDRILFRREVASRVHWTREGDRRVEVLGARQAIPIARRSVEALDDNELTDLLDLAIDPDRTWLLPRPPREGREGGGTPLLHPLAPDSEAHYRFRSGETATLRLADGRVIRLHELQVIPRRAEPTLVHGSLWLEAETQAPVRGVFSLAAPARMRLRGGSGVASFALADASFSMRHLTVEYGFWNGRWWLPRLVSFEGSGTVGGMNVPVVFEQRFEDYQVYAADEPVPLLAAVDTSLYRVLEPRCRRESQEDCPDRAILVPRDSATLLGGPDLPGSIFGTNWRLMSERELSELSETLGGSRWHGLAARTPRWDWTVIDAGLMRYNRVEGLTLGSSAGVELDPLSIRAQAWIGIAERSPSGQLRIARDRRDGEETLTAYRRLEAFSPLDRPFSLGSSVSAFSFGRDDGDYYRATGIGFSSEQAPTSSATLRVSGYMERQDAVVKQTDVSVPHWTDDHQFRANPAADEAAQVGLEVRARLARGLDPAGYRGVAEVTMQAEDGTFRFARPSGRVATTLPLPGPLVGALELSGGTAFGEVPAQRLWYVGGRGTVRGIRAEDRAVGEAFWAARAEIANDLPGARLILFSDAAWAGSRGDFTTDPTLVSAGFGVSFLDGLIRADLARPLRGQGSRWSLQFHLDAPL